MSVEAWTTVLVILSFILYTYIGWRSRVQDTKGFFVADRDIPSIANGAATAADWLKKNKYSTIVNDGCSILELIEGWTNWSR